MLFVVFSERNSALAKKDISSIPSQELRDNVRIVHLETLVAKLLRALPEPATVAAHYALFSEKYIIGMET